MPPSAFCRVVGVKTLPVAWLIAFSVLPSSTSKPASSRANPHGVSACESTVSVGVTEEDLVTTESRGILGLAPSAAYAPCRVTSPAAASLLSSVWRFGVSGAVFVSAVYKYGLFRNRTDRRLLGRNKQVS